MSGTVTPSSEDGDPPPFFERVIDVEVDGNSCFGDDLVALARKTRHPAMIADGNILMRLLRSLAP
jgi:hypothetical protein